MSGEVDTSEKSPWAEIVGPCYSAVSLARTLGWAPEQVTAAVESLSLLELKTEDGVLLYPAFQVANGQVVPGIGDLLRVLHSGTRSTWTWAQWMNSPVVDETGAAGPRAIEQLLAGHIDEVLRDARHAAAAWSN